MSGIVEYKCPACGGAMEFDSTLQKMNCPYCDTTMTVEEFEAMQKKDEDNTGNVQQSENAQWSSGGNNQWQDGETDNMAVYVCESCGGEIIADKTTGATTCPFCDNKIVMKGNFAGDLKPDCVIPFKLDKKAAKEAYIKHLKGKKYLPKVFKDENHIDEIKGVYVPFWLFDASVQADITYEAENIKIWDDGDTEYTEHEIYNAVRGGAETFSHVPADASKKMDDVLMESIEPFNYQDAVPFQSAYLAGYIADRYDVDKEERMQRAEERMKQAISNNLRKTVTGYASVKQLGGNFQFPEASYQYALYPVWILNTTWHNEKFVFAMNGQTGKLTGDLPLDKKAFRLTLLMRGGIFSIVFIALLWLLF
ncbi:hypothetical protein DW901_06930 [Firmicutes bacterium AM41-5BH]|nr:hypothetical protein DW901_06930 [Firmicutes bacterium AM41-5BH]